MKIAIITPYAMPEKGASTIRVESFRNYFNKKGHEVTVLAPFREGVGESYVVRYRSVRSLLRLLGGHDIVIGTSPPPIHNVYAGFFLKFKRVPFILDSKDLFTYQLSKLNSISESSLKFKLHKLTEYLSYKLADRILVVNNYIRDWVIESYGIGRNRFVLAMNGAVPDVVKKDSSKGSAIRKGFGIPKSAPTIIYIGSMDNEKPEMFLTESLSVIKKYGCHVIFVVAYEEGSVGEKQAVAAKELVKEIGLGNRFHIVSNVDYKDVAGYLSAADIGLSTLDIYDYNALPVKTFDYLSCELPVIAKSNKGNKELENFFRNHDVGFYTTEWDEFNRKLVKMLENLSAFKKKGVKGREIVKRGFTREKTSAAVLDTMLEVVGS